MTQIVRPGLVAPVAPVADVPEETDESPSTSTGRTALFDRVAAALAHVYDPCSIAAGRPTSLVDMGLLLSARRDGGTLTVRFCVTFAGCTMAPHFTEAARTELLKLDGIGAVAVEVDTAHVWTPPPLRALVGKPQAWREAVRA